MTGHSEGKRYLKCRESRSNPYGMQEEVVVIKLVFSWLTLYLQL